MLSGIQTTTHRLVRRTAKLVAVLCLFGTVNATALAQSASVPADFAVADTSQYNLITDSTSAITVSGSDPLRVTVSTSSGNIKVTTISGLAAPSGYSSSDWAGASEIAFTGSLADVNASLATLRYQGVGTITVSASPVATIFSTATNHFYEFALENVTWSEALSNAAAKSLNSTNGYLAVVTSAAENNDIISKLEPFIDCSGLNLVQCQSGGTFTRAWIAGSDETSEGAWFWRAGPENGSQFWQGAAAGNNVNGAFTNWESPNEPNNEGGLQHYLWLNSTGAWDDEKGNVRAGYIVEYDVTLQSFSVGLATAHSISLSDINKKADDPAFTITDPTSLSSGAFSYTSSDTSVATISGNTVTIQGAGSTIITATQASDGTYALVTTTATLTVSLNDNSISLSDITKQIDDPPFTITDPSSSSSGAFSYSISNSGVATISGNTVTPVGIGSATVTATQAADSTYASASTTFTLTVTENGTSVTSCSDAAARASHYIATGNSGYCGGSLTKAAAYIYEIWLGDSSTGMAASCRIWTGTLPVMRHQYQAGEKAQGGPIDVKNCSDGTYDTIHLIKSRYLQFAGYASYPAPSGNASHGNTARSTTTFATSNADHAVLGDWLEDSTGFAASSRPYVRTTSSATSIYKKLAAQPSSSDLASSSDADMYFDEYKRLTASQNNTSSGWLCEGASSQTVCAQILSNDTNRLEWRYTNAASEVSGLPITLSNAKGCSLTIDLSYKSADTSNNQNTGINFLWRNNSGTVEMVGVKPDDGDINISLGKPKC